MHSGVLVLRGAVIVNEPSIATDFGKSGRGVPTTMEPVQRNGVDALAAVQLRIASQSPVVDVLRRVAD